MEKAETKSLHPLSQYLKNFEKTKTPFYFYDLDHLQDTLHMLRESIKPLEKKYTCNVHYSMKANFDLGLLKTIKKAGFSIDCFNSNEIKQA